MAADDIDAYLSAVAEPHRSTLDVLRARIRKVLPGAEECISYGFPTFKVDGTGIAGFAAYKNHCSYFPMSGGVLRQLPDELAAYETSQGALRFPADTPLPQALVRRLVMVRLAEVEATRAARTK